jgi:hypothetical protein
MLFGLGAAILGSIAYALFIILTNIQIGIMAVAVGWMVATAMRKGAGRCGGKRYQISAAILIYAAVSLSAVPVAIYFWSQQHSAAVSAHTTVEPVGAVAALLSLALLGLASPFMELGQSPVSGAIGLFIIFIGIRYAWRMLRGQDPDLVGPFPA